MKHDPMVHNPPLPRNYATDLLVLERGDGTTLEDRAGNTYLDFGSGIAVNALGYGREDVARIAYEQMKKLIHVSNLYTTQPTIDLAAKLVESGSFSAGGFSAVHFGNSGSEANEAALKYSRLYAYRKRGNGHHRFLCFQNAFHGRTLGSLSVTPNLHYQEPYEPLIPGVETIPINDVESLERTVDDRFSAVICEVVQGEGGLVAMNRAFAEALNAICRKHDVLLIADEIQTGMGRTGNLYASQGVGLEPDIVTLSKPLAAGLPLSATLIPGKVNELLKPGDHGTTFGGGPVTTAVAGYVWDTITAPGFMERVQSAAAHLESRIETLQSRFPQLGELRGKGLLRGIPVGPEPEKGAQLSADILQAAREEGLLLLRSGKNVLRIAPTLVITDDEIDEGMARLERALRKFEKELS